MTDPQDLKKRQAAAAAAAMVEDGMKLGLGTGSTVNFFLRALGGRVAAGMRISGIPTSERTAALCRELGIGLLDFETAGRLDLAVDGADEIDPGFQMIKGGGGALLREKIVASAADRVVIAIDPSKRVDALGAFALPVEVVPFGHRQVARRLTDMGISYSLRKADGKPYVTDNGNLILDCAMGRIADPRALHDALNRITGVVDNGLFIDLCHCLVVGGDAGAEVIEK